MADRNRTDRDRDENLYRSVFQGERGSDFRSSPFIDRADREQFLNQQEEKVNSSPLRTVAKVAALGLGAYALGRTIPKDTWIEALHKLGKFGDSTFGEFMRARNEAILSFVDRQGTNAGTRQLGRDTELSRIFREELKPLFLELSQSNANTDARQYAERQTRAVLERRFLRSHPSTQRNTGLTVNDLIHQGKTYNNRFQVVSKRAYEEIMELRGRLDPDGQWFDNLVVDRHLYKAEYGKLPGAIKDTRWASKRALGQAAYNGLGFQIPFVGFKPVDLFAPFVRHFIGEGKSFAAIKPGQRLAQDVVAPKSGMTALMGGDLIHFGMKGPTRLAPGRKFSARMMDGIGKANLARLGTHPLQRAELEHTGPANTGKDFLSALQDFLGFGPKYRTQPQLFSRFITASRRRADMASGKTQFRFFETIRAEDLPFSHKLKHQVSKIKQSGSFDPDEIVANPYFGKTFDDLNWFQKRAALVGSEAGGYGGSRLGEFHAPGALPSKPRPLGSPPPNLSIYEDTTGTKLWNVAHYATTRLNDLIGVTTGIGFRPSMGKWGPLFNAIKIGAIGSALNPFNGYVVDAFKYVDYLFKRVSSGLGYGGEGIGPSDLLYGAYEYGTLGVAAARDALGITAGSQYAEDLFPGSTTSPLSGLARMSIPAYLMGGKGPKGFLAGLLLGGVGLGGFSDFMGSPIAGGRLTDSASQLSRYYSGEDLVGVKRSRWWLFGRSSIQGEGFERFEPHWLKLAKSGYEYSDVLYGSRREYFQHASRLPTFHNLFGLGSDEDYFAEKHYYDRPYHIAPSGGVMHSGEALPPNPIMPRGLTSQDMQTLGMPPIYPQYSGVQSAESVGIRARVLANNALEFLGIYKFLGETAFGKMSTGPVLASAADITSQNRLYWDKDLGDPFGMTELLRRYITKPYDYNPTNIINDIPNTMPSFLPGRRSMFAEDRQYYQDFTTGDPYTKVKGGEYRLPGAGYELTHKLYSGQTGVYSDVDAFLILSDVAPYSQAYKYYKSKVQGMPLSDEWRAKVNAAIEQRETRLQGFAADFRQRRFTSEDQIAAANYSTIERALGGLYERLTLDALPEVGRTIPFGTVITHKLFPNHTAEQDYYERQVMNARYSNWANPYEGFIRPKLGILYNENPLTASAGGALMGLAATTPVGMLTAGALGGAALGTASVLRATSLNRWEGGYIPGARQEEMAQVEYYDKLEYLRYNNAIEIANQKGAYELSSKLKRLQKTRTLSGLNLSQPYQLRYAYGALPKPERFYYEEFLDASPDRRERISELVPDYMNDLYRAVWNDGAEYRNNARDVSQYMATVGGVPPSDWAGYNLGIQKWQVMARMQDTPVSSAAIDLHRQHISTQMINQANSQIPDLNLIQGMRNAEISYTQEAAEWIATAKEKIALIHTAMLGGAKDVNVQAYSQASFDSTPHQRIRVQRDRTYERNYALAQALR